MTRKTFDASAYYEVRKSFDGHCLGCGKRIEYCLDYPGQLLPVRKMCCSFGCKMDFVKKTVKNWSEVRESVLQRDDRTCQNCGYIPPMRIEKGIVTPFSGLRKEVKRHWQTSDGLEVHHIIPISKGGAMWDEENLETLCTDCHKGKHAAAPKPIVVKPVIDHVAEIRVLHRTLDVFEVIEVRA